MTALAPDNNGEQIRSFLRGLFPAEAQKLLWLAGGTARDTLLRRQIKDIDLVAALPAAGVEQLGFRPVAGKTTGNIWFRHFHTFGKVEITRIAGPDALRHDLLRRDFTANALLIALDGTLVDPLGGIGDLATRQLRPCSKTSFLDDPLRIFRALRFIAEGFSLTEEAAALIRCNTWENELQKIPVERFSREMLKALAAPATPEFFRGMLEFSVGGGWLPELFRMPQIPAGPLHHHPEGDLFTHSIEVLQRVAAVTDASRARFCAFFHDIGKLSTDPLLYPKHHGHERAGFKMAEEFCRKLALPKDYGRALAWISRLHGNANKIDELRPATKIWMAEQAIRGGIVTILPLVSAADKTGNDFTAAWPQLLSVARMSCRELGIDITILHAMEPEKRSEFILHRRVQALKRLCRPDFSFS